MGINISLPRRGSQRSSSTNGKNSQGSGSGRQRSKSDCFVYEKGRRFHGEKDVPYPLPNDLNEVDRLDLQHFMIRYSLNGNHVCKLNHPQKMIDIGTGTGIWVMEMASEFPECQVFGIDISAIQPKAIIPPNVHFETMNILEGISYESNLFDYVHQRLLCAAIPELYWPELVKDLARICAPGGSVEIIESSALLYNGGPLCEQVNNWFNNVCYSRDIRLEKVWDIPEMLEAAGLNLETEHYIRLPMGEWCKELGSTGWQDLLSIITSVRPKIIATSHITDDEIDAVLENLHEEIIAGQAHWKVGIFIGHKP
ncbi:S-adenosyl-L-methionine-dependent methyltransferase [Syncephalis fuscata]|nr:S-adenosyl-L-methionine-dependent methyltransferase [Syncephalis fuscata]KAI9591286.1 S-adenosyl-L-methionine-dependent methyltransferase [Syncephalis fuscata]